MVYAAIYTAIYGKFWDGGFFLRLATFDHIRPAAEEAQDPKDEAPPDHIGCDFLHAEWWLIISYDGLMMFMMVDNNDGNNGFIMMV